MSSHGRHGASLPALPLSQSANILDNCCMRWRWGWGTMAAIVGHFGHDVTDTVLLL